MTKSKPLSQRNEAELLAIFDIFDIPRPNPDETTVKELRATLAQVGVDNKAIRAWEEKRDNKLDIKEYDGSDPEETSGNSGDVVVEMNRRNPAFEWSGYKWTQEKKFTPMPKEKALQLIQKYEGFRIASREDIKRHYK